MPITPLATLGIVPVAALLFSHPDNGETMSKRELRPRPTPLRSPIVEHEGQLYLIANWSIKELTTEDILALVPLTPAEAGGVRNYFECGSRELYPQLRPHVAARTCLDEVEEALACRPTLKTRAPTKRR